METKVVGKKKKTTLKNLEVGISKLPTLFSVSMFYLYPKQDLLIIILLFWILFIYSFK